MAKTGNYSAYKQVKPISSDLTSNMWKANDEVKQREAKKDLEKRRLKAENEKFANDLGTSLSKIQAKAIGMESVDHMIADVVIKARKRMHEAYEAKKKNPEDVDAIMTIKNLESLASDISLYTKTYGDHIKDISTGVQNGKYSRKLNLSNLEKINRTVGDNNGYFELGKDGRLVGVMVDPDGDGQVDFAPIDKVLDGSALTMPIPAADYFGSQEAIKTNYTTHKSNLQDPNDQYKSTETQELRPQDIEGIKSNTEALWGSVGEMTDFAKGVIADRLNLDPDTIEKEQFDKYKTDYSNEIINSYGTSNKEDYDFAGRAADGRLNEARRQNNKKTGKTEEVDTSADAFRTQVEGALAGNEKYLQNLVGINLDGYKDGTKIEEAEYNNGVLSIKLSDGEIKEIDTSDNEKAAGELMRMVRPEDNADERLDLFQRGKATEKFKKLEVGEKKVSPMRIRNAIPQLKGLKHDEAVKNLEMMGFAFKDGGNWVQRYKIQPKGSETVYDLESDADIAQLQEDILSGKIKPSPKEGEEGEENQEGEESQETEEKKPTGRAAVKAREKEKKEKKAKEEIEKKAKENKEKADKSKANHIAAGKNSAEEILSEAELHARKQKI